MNLDKILSSASPEKPPENAVKSLVIAADFLFFIFF